MQNGGTSINTTYTGREATVGNSDEVDTDLGVPAHLAIGGFSSAHAGGAQFAFADGSARFLSETIDVPLYSNLGQRDDGAIYGDF